MHRKASAPQTAGLNPSAILLLPYAQLSCLRRPLYCISSMLCVLTGAHVRLGADVRSAMGWPSLVPDVCSTKVSDVADTDHGASNRTLASAPDGLQPCDTIALRLGYIAHLIPCADSPYSPCCQTNPEERYDRVGSPVLGTCPPSACMWKSD
jgi:hypothetical protein